MIGEKFLCLFLEINMMQRISILFSILLLILFSSCAASKGGNRHLTKLPMEGKTPEVIIKNTNAIASIEIEPIFLTEINSSDASGIYIEERDYKLNDAKPESVNLTTDGQDIMEAGNTKNKKEIKLEETNIEKKEFSIANLSFLFGVTGLGIFVLALLLFVLFSFSMSLFFLVLAYLFTITAFILGIIALQRIKKEMESSNEIWKAKFGVIIGSVAILAFVVAIVAYLFSFLF